MCEDWPPGLGSPALEEGMGSHCFHITRGPQGADAGSLAIACGSSAFLLLLRLTRGATGQEPHGPASLSFCSAVASHFRVAFVFLIEQSFKSEFQPLLGSSLPPSCFGQHCLRGGVCFSRWWAGIFATFLF